MTDNTVTRNGDDGSTWLDAQGAATRVQGSESTILRAARRGSLRAYKLGSRWRFRPADVDAWLEQANTPVAVSR